MKLLKERADKNRVYVECSETTRKVKGIILRRDDRELEVEMPTGYVLHMQKKSRRGQYSFRIGMVEFHTDGRPVS